MGCSSPRETQPKDLRILSDTADLRILSDATIICPTGLDDRDYAIYSAILARIYAGPPCRASASPRFLILKELGGGSWVKDSESVRRAMESNKLDPAIAASFLCRNSAPASLDSRLTAPIPYTLLESSSLGPLDALFKANPDAIALIQLSMIGYDSPSTEALVYYSSMCDGLRGGGYYALLAHEGTVWVVQKVVDLWVA